MKPWMSRRAGETVAEYRRRLNHSCYRCGHYEDDLAVLDDHEGTCSAPTGAAATAILRGGARAQAGAR